MKGYTATLDTGEAIYYMDRKRWLWLMSVVYPLQPLAGIWLHAETGHEAWLLLPLVFSYGLLPVLDWLIGEDKNNPPEEVVLKLDADRYYRLLTYAVVPLHSFVFNGMLAGVRRAAIADYEVSSPLPSLPQGPDLQRGVDPS